MDHSENNDSGFVRISFAMERVTRTCREHGEYQASIWRGTESGCFACVKLADEKRRAVEKAEADAKNRAEQWERKLGRAAIPERFADKTLENYRPTCSQSEGALRVAQSYADGFNDNAKLGRCLIFSGDVGTGKTHLAIGIAHALIKKGKQPVFVSVIKAVRKIKETYSRDVKTTEDEAIQSFIEPDLLILDEVGVQFGSDTEKLYLFEIINGRYEKSKPTILISNLSLKELETFVGSRVMDRLREGGGKAVVFDWQSYRRAA